MGKHVLSAIKIYIYIFLDNNTTAQDGCITFFKFFLSAAFFSLSKKKKKSSLHKIALVRSKGHFSTKAIIIMCIADIYNTDNITVTEALAMAHCLRPESQLSTTYIQVCIRYSPALCTA